jgi:hypothetical protein
MASGNNLIPEHATVLICTQKLIIIIITYKQKCCFVLIICIRQLLSVYQQGIYYIIAWIDGTAIIVPCQTVLHVPRYLRYYS